MCESWDEDAFYEDCSLSRERKRQHRHGIKRHRPPLTVGTVNGGLELPVEEINNDGLIPFQVVVPGLTSGDDIIV